MINEGNVIKPSDGMVLTNGDIYATLSIRLGDGDNEDNYTEITLEEYDEILQAQMEEELMIIGVGSENLLGY